METGKPEKTDILFIAPSADYKKHRHELELRKIEEGIVIQNSVAPGIGYMMAVAKRNGLKVRFLDMVMEPMTTEDFLGYIAKYNPALVGFTAMTVQINDAGFLAAEIKKHFPGIMVCAGGIHATVMPVETLEQFTGFDFLVLGEGEYVMVKVMEQLRAGKPLSEIKGVLTRGKTDCSFEMIADLDEVPFPAWEEMPVRTYGGVFPHRTKLELPMSTSRGCPNSCVFCVRPWGRVRRHRSVGNVIAEIERNVNEFGCEAIAFIDETFIIDKKWGFEFFDAMKAKGLNKKVTWGCEVRVDVATPELFASMKEAGCYYIFFGIESGNEAILKTVQKNSDLGQIKTAVKWAKDAGIIPAGSIIIGLPGETKATVYESIALAKELDLYSITFPIAVPFPGTVLRKMAQKREYGLKILTDNWSDYGKQYPGVMDSDALNIDQLRELQKYAYEQLPKKKIGDYIKKLESAAKKPA